MDNNFPRVYFKFIFYSVKEKEDPHHFLVHFLYVYVKGHVAVHVDAKVLNVIAWSAVSVVKIDSCVRWYLSSEWSSTDKKTLNFVRICYKTVSVKV